MLESASFASKAGRRRFDPRSPALRDPRRSRGSLFSVTRSPEATRSGASDVRAGDGCCASV